MYLFSKSTWNWPQLPMDLPMGNCFFDCQKKKKKKSKCSGHLSLISHSHNWLAPQNILGVIAPFASTP